MADVDILANEIATDPLARGYAGMTDGQIAADINLRNRSIQGMNASDLQANASSGVLQQIELIQNSGAPASQIAAAVASLQGTLRTVSNVLTRAEELGIAPVKTGHVAEARRLNA